LGAPTSENVRVCGGTIAVGGRRRERVRGQLRGWSPRRPARSLIAGNVFTSVTVSVIAASVLAVPSLTRTVNGYAPGPCASLGVQLKAPVLALIAALGGAPTSENVSACAGRSPSVAVAVNV
jgi:hypothetical protein